MEEVLSLVRGRRVERTPAATLRELARQYERVIVDIGTGDGRWLYRMARSAPAVLCLGVDLNADVMREVSHRAGRKPARGGVPNIRFISAALDALPAGLQALADTVYVLYPWGSLLRAVALPDPALLQHIAALLAPTGRFLLAINATVLQDAGALARTRIPLRSPEALRQEMVSSYKTAGLSIVRWAMESVRLRSSWGSRLGQGGPVPTLYVEAMRKVKSRGGERWIPGCSDCFSC